MIYNENVTVVRSAAARQNLIARQVYLAHLAHLAVCSTDLPTPL